MANLFNRGDAAKIAAEIVKAAVQSGSIRLMGSASEVSVAAAHATNDAKYLGTLVDKLADELTYLE
jgi:hydroxymethylglutaryl-CoA reductase